MKYASVCDGIGAAHAAWQPLGWQCMWTSEIDPFPSAVVEQRWGFENRGDMTKHKEWTVDEGSSIDLLVGGTPCQSFSVAGLRQGLKDPRGNLMLTYLAIAERLKPRWLVWENVPGVLSSNGGGDFGSFLGALGDLGFGWAYRVLDAQWFGVAQRRRRVFVVGCFGDATSAAKVLFESESVQRNPAPCRQKGKETTHDVAPCIGASGRGYDRAGEPTGQDPVVATYRMASFGEYTEDGTASAIKPPDYKDATDLVSRPRAFYSTESCCDGIPSHDVTPCLTSSRLQRIGDTRGQDPVVAVQDITGPIAGCSNGGGANSPGRTAEDADSLVVAHVPVMVMAHGQANAEICEGHSPTLSCAHEVPIAFHPTQDPISSQDGVVHALGTGSSGGCATAAVAFTAKGSGADAGALCPTIRAGGHSKSHANGGVMPAVAHTLKGRGFDGSEDGTGRGTPLVPVAMAVRRLTPRECERLQGFPDDYTAITYRKKPAADGPRYKSLGNSMAVPCMRWIGERIEAADRECVPK